MVSGSTARVHAHGGRLTSSNIEAKLGRSTSAGVLRAPARVPHVSGALCGAKINDADVGGRDLAAVAGVVGGDGTAASSPGPLEGESQLEPQLLLIGDFDGR